MMLFSFCRQAVLSVIRTDGAMVLPMLFRMLLFLLGIVSLAACRLEITVPAGGRVVGESGFACASGDTCVIEVTEDNFNDVFRAEPAVGYTFSHWKKKKRAFCGEKRGVCALTTNGFAAHPLLLGILASDETFFLEPVFAPPSRYDVAAWALLLQEIGDRRYSTDTALYRRLPDVDNCDAGELTAGATLRALETVNLVRALHGLPRVEYDDSFDAQVQAASLVQRANNFLSHFPGPGDLCFSRDAETGAGTSNLNASSEPTDPASDILGWTNDNRNVADLAAAGHRRWVLFPELGFVSYGQVEGFSALKVFGFNRAPGLPVSSDLEFVAFPHGTYPYVLVSQGDAPTPWSLSMVPAPGVSGRFDYFSGASVAIEHKETGEPLAVRSIHTDTDGFGLANFLSWMVEDWEYDTAYVVKVSGVRMPGGMVRDIRYEVLVDRFNLLDLDEPLEKNDTRNGNRLTGEFDTPRDQDSYTVPLSGSRSFSGQSNFSQQAFYITVYDDRKRLVLSSDQPFTRQFAPGDYTVIVSPCNDSGRCYLDVARYVVDIR